MNLGRLLHQQYYLTNTGLGLAQACNKLLHRKYLADSATKGPFFHHLEELLTHVATARVRNAWMKISGSAKLDDLRSENPEKLANLAQRIREELMSTSAIFEHDSLPQEDQDEVFRQGIHTAAFA